VSSADQQTQALLIRVGSRVRAARDAAGLTQEGLAAKIGVTRTSVTNIERGRQGLTLMRLGQLAVALGISLDALIIPAEFPVVPQATRHKAGVIRAWAAACATCGADLGWNVDRGKAVQLKNDHIAQTLSDPAPSPVSQTGKED
jgi:transcriptional regulator with XRE-family HTH domain